MDMIGIQQTYMTWETVEGWMKSNPWTLIRVTGQKMASHRRQTSATLKKKIDQRWFCWPETCSRLLCGIKVLCVTVHFVLQCSFSASTSVGGESFVKRFGNIEPSFGYKIGFHLKALSQTLPNERQKITECLWLFDVAQDSTCSQFNGLLAFASGTEMKTVLGFDLMRCRIWICCSSRPLT